MGLDGENTATKPDEAAGERGDNGGQERGRGETKDAIRDHENRSDGEDRFDREDRFEIEEHPDIEDLLDRLDELSDAVDEPHERDRVEETISMVYRMPGSTAFTEHIYKYTSRDLAEALVGSVIFALPFLVEDGVFVIASWLTAVRIGPIPIAFVVHIVFILGLTGGLLYYADIREVRVTRPVFGVIPRRYLGVLLVSFGAAFGLLALWGRLALEDPTPFEALARVTVVWSAAALGAALGDILPGESKGEDISDLFDE